MKAYSKRGTGLLVVILLVSSRVSAQGFADFDTEIFTTSLVQEGDAITAVRLNPIEALADLRKKSQLVLGVSPQFADLGDLGADGNAHFSANLRLGNRNADTSLKLDRNSSGGFSRFVWGVKWQLSSRLETGFHLTPAILGLHNNGWSVVLQRTDWPGGRRLSNKLTLAGGKAYARDGWAFDHRLEYRREFGGWIALVGLQTRGQGAGDELAVVLEPALAGRVGDIDVRGVLVLGVAGANKPAGLGLKLTAATRFHL